MNHHPPPRFLNVLFGWPGLLLAFAWGFAEGTLFFIVPDVLLTLTALFSIRRSLMQMAAVTAGAILAGALMFHWALDGRDARKAVEQVPFVSAKMFVRIDSDFQTHGPLALVRGPFSGIPYKAYAVEAPAYISLTQFLLWSLPARLERFIITWVLFAAFGLFIRSRHKNLNPVAVAIHLAYWVCVYILYWTLI